MASKCAISCLHILLEMQPLLQVDCHQILPTKKVVMEREALIVIGRLLRQSKLYKLWALRSDADRKILILHHRTKVSIPDTPLTEKL